MYHSFKIIIKSESYKLGSMSICIHIFNDNDMWIKDSRVRKLELDGRDLDHQNLKSARTFVNPYNTHATCTLMIDIHLDTT